jgi:hypothetical protein
LGRIAFEERHKAEQLGPLPDAPLDLGPGHATHAEPEADVARDAHVREHRVALKDHRDVAVSRREVGDIPLSDVHATAVQMLEARDAAKERGLAATGRSEKDHELAVADVERHALQGGGLPEDLGRAGDADRCHQREPHRFMR